MRNDGHFDKDDFKFHFNLYIFKFSEKARKGRPTSEDTVEVVYYKDYSEVGEFTQDVFRYLRQSDQI